MAWLQVTRAHGIHKAKKAAVTGSLFHVSQSRD